jgi:hypothetical protein
MVERHGGGGGGGGGDPVGGAAGGAATLPQTVVVKTGCGACASRRMRMRIAAPLLFIFYFSLLPSLNFCF